MSAGDPPYSVLRAGAEAVDTEQEAQQQVYKKIKELSNEITVMQEQGDSKDAALIGEENELKQCPKDKNPQCPEWQPWCQGTKPWGTYTQTEIRTWMQAQFLTHSDWCSSPSFDFAG